MIDAQSVIQATQQRLAAHSGHLPDLAREFGLSLSTLTKFQNGERGANARYTTVIAIQNMLDELDARESAQPL